MWGKTMRAATLRVQQITRNAPVPYKKKNADTSFVLLGRSFVHDLQAKYRGLSSERDGRNRVYMGEEERPLPEGVVAPAYCLRFQRIDPLTFRTARGTLNHETLFSPPGL